MTSKRQGCLKAAVGAIILDGMLKKKPYSDSTEILPGFARQFFKRQREVIEPIWEGNKPVDYMFPTTKPIEGESLSKFHLMSRFGNLVTELATYVRFYVLCRWTVAHTVLLTGA